EATIINALITQLNTQAGICTPTLFVAPTGPNLGSIPAGAQVIFFLGAGGNQSGTMLPGFDLLGTNMDFTSYCNGASIYAVFGQQPGATTLFGLLANGGARGIRIQVGGTTADSVFSPGTPGGTNPEILDSAGVFTSGGPCTPIDLFGLAPLDASQESRLTEEENANAVFRMYPNPASESITVSLPFSGPETIQQKFYSIDGKSTKIRTFILDEGKNELQIELGALPPTLYTLELFSQQGVFRSTFLRK
ncbi:MAG: hypothetical protein AAGM67_18145, partial [Bacteroidota bacterium]